MKKFNIDELIWFLVQVILLILMVYLKNSDKITYFISSKMLIYFNIAIIILILYSIAQITKIFTIRSRNSITNKFFPLVFVIVLSVLFLYVEPNYRLLQSGNVEKSSIRLDNIDEDNLIKIDNDNYELIKDISDNVDKYKDKLIEITAFIYKTNTEYNDESIIGREVVSCCQSDKSLIEIRVKGINNIKEGTWINLIGRINYDESLFLECISYENTEEPINIYFHEEL